jgi:hypothetical protein
MTYSEYINWIIDHHNSFNFQILVYPNSKDIHYIISTPYFEVVHFIVLENNDIVDFYTNLTLSSTSEIDIVKLTDLCKLSINKL